MANHCNNYIKLENITKEQSLVLISWINSYSNFNYISDWLESIVPKKELLPDKNGNYGGKWFDISHYEYEKDCSTFIIQGDSAWSPMINLVKTISNYFGCPAIIEFEEPGNDFGGFCSFSEGKLNEEINKTYLGWRVFNEGFEAVLNEADCRDENYFGFLRILVSSGVKLTRLEQQQLKKIYKDENN